MNISQKQSILNSIQSFEQTDINSLLIEAYPGETNFAKINLQNYSAASFLNMLLKMLQQLKAEVESELGLFLPNQENFNNDFGTLTLDIDLNLLLVEIQNKQFIAAEQKLEKFVFYQILYGFWDKSRIKKHSVDSEVINQQYELIKLNNVALVTNIQNFENLKIDISNKYEEINLYLAQKQGEFDELTSNLLEANAILTQISSINSTASNKETEIAGLVVNVKDKITAVSENIDAYKAIFEELKTESNGLNLTLKTDLIIASDNLERAAQNMKFIDSKKDEIVRLTGMAADGSLGSKFNQRERTLVSEVRFWRWSIPIVILVSIMWTIIVFTKLGATFENSWVNLIVDILKTFPAYILLGFVFAQYSKERNLQEEYAFKSAISMTLTAYSDMLKSSDDEVNKSRQSMLLQSIDQIYKQPKIHSKNKGLNSGRESKNLKETLQIFIEAVKSLKS